MPRDRDPTDDPALVQWFTWVCAGVFWMKRQDRAEYAALLAEVRGARGKEGGVELGQEVKQGVDFGFICPEEFEPRPRCTT